MVRNSAGPLAAGALRSEPDGWSLLLAVVRRLRAGRGALPDGCGIRLDDAGALQEVEAQRGWIVLRHDDPAQWSWPPAGPTGAPPSIVQAAELFDLYMPLCSGPTSGRMTVAHLAQSLDGRVATRNGVSQFISGQEDLVHTHRMRALFDAVVVGASTVEHDDPQLTTRLVDGDDPTRVIVDPKARLRADHRVFRDGGPPTLVIVGCTRVAARPALPDHVVVVDVDDTAGWVPVPRILDALHARGLHRVFVEGGGVTVSRFLQAGVLDRLHVTVAPMIIGSGRPAFVLPEIEHLDDALQLPCRHFALGRDILFDCPVPR